MGTARQWFSATLICALDFKGLKPMQEKSLVVFRSAGFGHAWSRAKRIGGTKARKQSSIKLGIRLVFLGVETLDLIGVMSDGSEVWSMISKRTKRVGKTAFRKMPGQTI